MATVYQKTDNYGLDLYGDNDPADLRDGHNTNMRTIDGKLKDHSDAINSATITANAAKAEADKAAPQATTYTKDEIDQFNKTFSDFDENLSNANKKLANAVLLGIDNTGTSDVSKAIQKIVNSNLYRGLYFPNGEYHLDTHVDFGSMSVNADNAARFTATKKMDSMFLFSTTEGTDNTYYYQSYFLGGEFNGNRLAQTCIKTSGKNFMTISNLRIHGFISVGMDLNHATHVSNCYISGESVSGSIGLRIAIDSFVSDMYIWHCQHGISTKGQCTFNNIYIYAGTNGNIQDNITTGFTSEGGAFLAFCNNIYLDTVQKGFYAPSPCPLSKIKITNLFYYAGAVVSNNMSVYDLTEQSYVNAATCAYSSAGRNIAVSDSILSTGEIGTGQDAQLSNYTRNIGYFINSHNTSLSKSFNTVLNNTVSVPAHRAVKILTTRNRGEAYFSLTLGNHVWMNIKAYRSGLNKAFLIDTPSKPSVKIGYVVKNEYIDIFFVNDTDTDFTRQQMYVKFDGSFTIANLFTIMLYTTTPSSENIPSTIHLL